MGFKVDHFAFLVYDMDRAIQFYTEKLGLKLMSRQTDKAHGEEFAFLELEGGNLELLQRIPKSPLADKPSPGTTANCPHLALEAANFDDFVEQMRKSKIEIVNGPYLIEDTVKWVYIADPDGNLIEFVEWLNKK